jgi:tetratricopeptide (TPR) repeat protein
MLIKKGGGSAPNRRVFVLEISFYSRMSLQDASNLLYSYYMNYTSPQLLETGKELFQQGLIEEQKPQFYSYAGSQFMKGNPFVPYNNPTDIALNEARLFTYDDSFSQINELGDRYREYSRKINFIWAHLFFSKSLYLNPSDSEAQQYINLILSKLNLSPINILRNGYAMFKDYGLTEWVQVCNGLLNNAVKSSPLRQNEAILIEMDKRLRINSNDSQALLGKGFILFQMAKKDSTLDAKRSKLIESIAYISRAITLTPSYLTEYNEIIRNLTDTINEVDNLRYKPIINKEKNANTGNIYYKQEEQKKNIGNLVLNIPLKSNNSSILENKSKKIKRYTSEGKPVYE